MVGGAVLPATGVTSEVEPHQKHGRAMPYLGSVVIPAHNEGSVLGRTLGPLSEMVRNGEIQLVIAANGCTDDTVVIARSVPGVVVIDLAEASKTAALNAADAVATTWPRLYLDADVTVTPSTVRDVLEAVSTGPVLAVRPAMVYALGESSFLVRAFYRTRRQIGEVDTHLWGGGTYAVSRQGRARFALFPDVIGDDLYVDTRFRSHEKAVVSTTPVVVHAPRTLRDLRNILRRTYRGNRELSELGLLDLESKTTPQVAIQLVCSVRGPRSFFDASVYSLIVVLARVQSLGSRSRWERDNSSRLPAAD